MEQTLQALAGILLKSIPTICLLIFLYFYLKLMLFGPLNKILKQRDALTAGTRHAAERSLQEAERKIQEYQARMQEARAEVYREQEEVRRVWLTDQAAQVAGAHEAAAAGVSKAKHQIETEAAAARQNLFETSGSLADEIASAVLLRKRA